MGSALSLVFDVLTWLAIGSTLVLLFVYRRTRYSAGWVDGRIALLRSMDEAYRRGIPVREWIRAEALRDATNHRSVLGWDLQGRLEDIGDDE
jgi:hypothetical protein